VVVPPVDGALLLGAVVVGVAGALELVGAGVDGVVRVGEVVRVGAGVRVRVGVGVPGDVVWLTTLPPVPPPAPPAVPTCAETGRT
jgi:hypothetical protein